ncbi:MAG: hypothetical protein IPI30_10715 [Saprospiraceae bacterium]|nr:hypothetical protein [Candidatus Vicinibacter affinis]
MKVQNIKTRRCGLEPDKSCICFNKFYRKSNSATNFKDIAIELWEVKQFENDTIIINPIKKIECS